MASRLKRLALAALAALAALTAVGLGAPCAMAEGTAAATCRRGHGSRSSRTGSSRCSA